MWTDSHSSSQPMRQALLAPCFSDVATETHRAYVIFLKITQIVISENGVNQISKILETSSNYPVIMSKKKKKENHRIFDC